MMLDATWIVKVAFITLLKELASNGGKENELS